MRAGDALSAAAAYCCLFSSATARHTTHRELHVAHANSAEAHLQLGLFAAALQHADASLALMRRAEAAGGAPLQRQPSYPKLQLRRWVGGGDGLSAGGTVRKGKDGFCLRAGLRFQVAVLATHCGSGRRLHPIGGQSRGAGCILGLQGP